MPATFIWRGRRRVTDRPIGGGVEPSRADGPSPTSKPKHCHISVTGSLYERLAARSARDGVSIASIVERVIDAHLPERTHAP